MRLTWDLTVWLLTKRAAAMSGLVMPRAIMTRISASRLVSPSGNECGRESAGADGGGQGGLDAGVENRETGGRTVQGPGDVGAVGVLRQETAGTGAQGGQDRV